MELFNLAMRQTVTARWHFRRFNRCSVVAWKPDMSVLSPKSQARAQTAALFLLARMFWGREAPSNGGYKRAGTHGIERLCQEGKLDKALDALMCFDEQGDAPSVFMYRALLKACAQKKALAQSKRVHSHMAKRGLDSSRILGESVVNTFVKCGGLDDALQVFHRLPQRTVFAWTAIISGYAVSGKSQEALCMYRRMQEEGVHPDTCTFVNVLKACAAITDLNEGKRIHSDAFKYRCEADLFVRTSLIDMYGKCGSLPDAEKVFVALSRPDVVAWNAMLTVYAEQGCPDKALQLYDKMQAEGLSPNRRTFVSVLQACGMLGEKNHNVGQVGKDRYLDVGKAVHAHIDEKGYRSDVFVGSSLVSMYGKCGSIEDAIKVFDGLSHRTVVTWNTMIAAYVQQGQAAQALQLYNDMQGRVSPDVRTIVSALQACGMLAERGEEVVFAGGRSTKPVHVGKAIHDQARRKGFQRNVFVGNTLIGMYGKCRLLAEAQNAFDGMVSRNVVSWNAMLNAFVLEGEAGAALALYQKMGEECVSPNDRTFVTSLHACSMLAEKGRDNQRDRSRALEKGKAIHADAKRRGYLSDTFVGTALVRMYGKCRSSASARDVFDGLLRRDIVSWNAMLVAYAEQDQSESVLQLYEQMLKEDLSPDPFTFITALQACGKLAEQEEGVVEDRRCYKAESVKIGKAIHADVQKKGFHSDVFVGSALICMYGKCGNLVHAQSVFYDLQKHDVVAWNALLKAYTEQGQAEKALQLYNRMTEGNLTPVVQTFMIILHACALLAENEAAVVENRSIQIQSLERLRAVHADVRKRGIVQDLFLGTMLIGMYAKSGSVEDARNTFDALLHRDAVVWCKMVAAYAEHGHPDEAWEMYVRMRKEGLNPDVWTFVCILQACGTLAEKEGPVVVDGQSIKLEALKKGKAAHADAESMGYSADLFASSTLVSMYGKCGSIVDAQKVFDSLSVRSVVSWNALLAAYVEQDQAAKALEVFEQMPSEDISPNDRSFVTVLQACGSLAQKAECPATRTKYLERGKALHADAERKLLISDVFVSSTLISMYGKCGSLLDAERVFTRFCGRTVVVWNAMLTAYTELGKAEEAFNLYKRMSQENVSPDVCTFLNTLQACGMLADREEELVVDGQSIKVMSLKKGRAVHADVQRKGCGSDSFISSSLISMYGKCGSIADAQTVFNSSSLMDVVSWNSMLAAFVEQGEGEKAMHMYRRMQQDGIRSDDITLVCVLQACSMTGSLAILRHVHRALTTTSKDLSPFLASCLIGAYGRCAKMVDAQAVFDSLPQPDAVSWNALIAGYAREGNCAASLQQYEAMQLAGMKPNGASFLSILTACSHAGLVNRGLECFESMSRDHNMSPEIDHYVAMVDLLCRAGCFSKVEELLSAMPLQPNLSMWLCLLGACRKHGKVELGEKAFRSAVSIEPKHAAPYVLMANIYSDAGLLDLADEVKKSRQVEAAWKKPGQSWIEHEQEVHTFSVGDHKHPQQKRLYGLLRTVTWHPVFINLQVPQ